MTCHDLCNAHILLIQVPPQHQLTLQPMRMELGLSISPGPWREGVAVNFTVTVTNLNDSSTGPMEVSGIRDQHYIFTLEDSTSCDVYSFQVTAMNGAGTGTPSQIITRSLPSLPDISPVQDSLQHSLVRTASGVTLMTVTFNVRTLLDVIIYL